LYRYIRLNVDQVTGIGAARAARVAMSAGRVLALDHGAARCGCAVSDPSGTLATPLGAIERPETERGLATLAELVRETGAERVVVGLPRSMSGDEGPQAAAARSFAGRVARAVEVPVELHDERLTTRQAQRSGGAADEDSRAAAHLLEAWLATQRTEPATGSAGSGPA
jgi:putative Holliday junction resolvase